MPTATRAATCPLCKDEFDDAVLFGAHLAGAHGLIDDEGTETALPEVEPEPVAVATAAGFEPEPEPEVEPEPERMVVVSTPARVVPPSPNARRVLSTAPVWLVLIVVVQLLVGIAGAVTVGDDDNDAETASVQTAAGASRPTPAPTAAPSSVDPLLDQQLADQAVLRIGDLPPGWAVDAESVESTPADDQAFMEGVGQGDCWDNANAPIVGEDSALAESAFAKELSGAFSEVQVFSSEDKARLGVQAARNLMPCLAEGLRAAVLDEGGELTLGDVQPLGFPSYGDESIALTVQGTIVAPAIRVPFRVDGLIVRVDRAVTFVTAVVLGTDLSQSDEKFLMEKVADRMRGEAA